MKKNDDSHLKWLENYWLEELNCLQRGETSAEQLAGKIAKIHASLDEKTIRDNLTLAFNRGYVLDTLEWELLAAKHQNEKVGIIFVDLDDFKKINDLEPEKHTAGDRALKELVFFMKLEVFDKGFVGRYGGEEFLIVVLDTDFEELIRIAKNMGKNIKDNLAVKARLKTRDQVTASMGLAIFGDEETVVNFVQRADGLMYQAKKAGKSRLAYEKDGQVKIEEI